MGKGVIDADDEYALFTAGLRAQDYPKGFMGKSDLVLCVGYDLVEWSPEAWNPRSDRRIICIDTVASEIDAALRAGRRADRRHLPRAHAPRQPGVATSRPRRSPRRTTGA